MDKHWQYAVYLARHKWFVFIAGLRTGAPLWRLLIHDWSKLLPCEWFPYAEFFYGEAARLKKEEWDDCRYWELVQPYRVAFDAAWLHHQHANPHHWQHWELRNDDGSVRNLPMPEHFIREMVADWAGAGRGIKGTWEVASWYQKNREIIRLEGNTRAKVEQLLASIKWT